MTAPPKKMRDLESALAALPENIVGEIIFGRLVTQPRPVVRHAEAQSALIEVLRPLVYAANDVGFLWLVDIAREQIEAYRSERGKWQELGTFGAGAQNGIAPFDAVPFAPSLLFSR